MNNEKLIKPVPGWLMLVLLIGLLGLDIWWMAGSIKEMAVSQKDGLPVPFWGLVFSTVGFLIISTLMAGFFIVEPNGSKVMLLFGNYKGTVREAGLGWANPFYSKRSMSLRVRNLLGDTLKVNDLAGNPVDIAAIIVWQISDTYRASFEVDNYEQYVLLQTETSVRHLASTYPYDSEDHEMSLRHNTDEVSDVLSKELQDRVKVAGVTILDARLAHLAYAPEIAGAMLRRQQAAAVIAARTRIVDGAVSMVEMALKRLEENKTVDLDEERKAAMVSNLMVVLCSEHGTQPVVNAGTLYP